MPESLCERARCVPESLALKCRVVVGQIDGLTGVPVRVVRVVGRGSRNGLVNQFTADACGVQVVVGPVDATVLGNVLVQASAVGELDSAADLRAVVREPTPLAMFEPKTSGS